MENKPLLQDFNVLKAIELMQNGQYREALKTLNEIIKDGAIISLREVSKLKALSYFYIQDYKHAVSIYKELKNEELSDQDDCTYNLALCYIILKQHELAITHLNELAYISSGENKGQILFLIGHLNLSLSNESDGKDLIHAAIKLCKSFNSSSPNFDIFPFSSNTDLSSKFPSIPVHLPDSITISLRPSFSLPSVDLPVFDFPVESCILDQFSIKSIKVKPEAPWLNRVQGMIQFTDEVQENMSETVSESVVEPDEDFEEDVFDEGIESFKKYRSAICLMNMDSDKLFESMQGILAD